MRYRDTRTTTKARMHPSFSGKAPSSATSLKRKVFEGESLFLHFSYWQPKRRKPHVTTVGRVPPSPLVRLNDALWL